MLIILITTVAIIISIMATMEDLAMVGTVEIMERVMEETTLMAKDQALVEVVAMATIMEDSTMAKDHAMVEPMQDNKEVKTKSYTSSRLLQ